MLKFVQHTCTLLNDHEIPYMISGSVAANLYTVPRMTMDLDIVIELPEHRVSQFVMLFTNHYLNEYTIHEEVKRKGMFNIIDNESGFKIDFIIRKDDEYSKVAFSRRVPNKDMGVEAWVISLEDLILAKLRWIQDLYSEKQASDIENLLFSPCDVNYIKKWANHLHLKTYQLLTQ